MVGKESRMQLEAHNPRVKTYLNNVKYIIKQRSSIFPHRFRSINENRATISLHGWEYCKLSIPNTEWEPHKINTPNSCCRLRLEGDKGLEVAR